MAYRATRKAEEPGTFTETLNIAIDVTDGVWPNLPSTPAGNRAAIEETARLTEQRIELEEDSKEKLDRKQQFLENIAAEHPEITVTWFLPDEKKDGGSYVTHSGKLKKTDNMNRIIVMMDGTKIPPDDIIGVESIQFHGMFQNNF